MPVVTEHFLSGKLSNTSQENGTLRYLNGYQTHQKNIGVAQTLSPMFVCFTETQIKSFNVLDPRIFILCINSPLLYLLTYNKGRSLGSSQNKKKIWLKSQDQKGFWDSKFFLRFISRNDLEKKNTFEYNHEPKE